MRIRPIVAATILLSFILSLCSTIGVEAQTTKFNYQGKLNEGGNVATGAYSMKFSLFDAESAGTQIGSTITETSVTVTNGIFSVVLDFGTTPFSGAARYLEVEVKKATDVGYTTLSPRQQILASPYSLKTLSASSADALSSNCVGCVADSHIADVAGTKVTGSVASADTLSSTLPIAKGGTGATTKPFVDLTDNQTIAGNKEFTGITKFSGDVQFAGKINTFKSISGYAYGLIFSNPGFQWVGPVGLVEITGSQTVAVSATATVGSYDLITSVQAAICYLNSSPGGSMSSLTGGTQTFSLIRGQYNSISLNATNSTLPVGSYYMGVCLYNVPAPYWLDHNGSVSGWAMIFQN